jgi:hypothetical protein
VAACAGDIGMKLGEITNAKSRIEQRFPKPKVGGSSPLGTANNKFRFFYFKDLSTGLPLQGPRFATSAFLIWSLRFAIPLVASRLRSASSV